MAHLGFEPGSLSDSHTINGHSIVLRLTFGHYRMLFAGDLNNAVESALVADPAVDLEAEVFKVPHHGSHEFETPFLKAASPLVSVVSSGDERELTEHIHPRATLMNALGRCSRDDTSLIFVTELAAFFKLMGQSVTTPPKGRGGRTSASRAARSGACGCAPTASTCSCSPTAASATSTRPTRTTPRRRASRRAPSCGRLRRQARQLAA